jgi:hypothetical protein
MAKPETEKHPPVPWHVSVAVEQIAETGSRFDLVADGKTRAAVARMARLRELPRLEATFEVKRHGIGGLRVGGRVSATVGQTCVVTLEPLTNEVAEDIDLVFLPQPAAAAAGAAEDASAGTLRADQTEPLVGGQIDLGALAVEFLILGLDPYPRKPGAVFQPPQDTTPDEGTFAGLAALKQSRDDH